MVAENFLAEQAAMNVLKGILSALSLVFLAAFYVHWMIFKYTHNTMDYIAKQKIVKSNSGLGVGLLVLSAGLMLDSFNELGILKGEGNKIVVDALLVIAISLFGYWYYKLTREGRRR